MAPLPPPTAALAPPVLDCITVLLGYCHLAHTRLAPATPAAKGLEEIAALTEQLYLELLATRPGVRLAPEVPPLLAAVQVATVRVAQAVPPGDRVADFVAHLAATSTRLTGLVLPPDTAGAPAEKFP